METQIITLFCIVTDFLKAINFYDDSQVQISTAEVITTAIVAGKFFQGNLEISRMFLRDHKYIKNMLSKSRLNRRIHQIDVRIFNLFMSLLREIFKTYNQTNEYTIDSFPVPVCKNIRIRRCKIYKDKIYRGYNASNRLYFFGLKVHMICTIQGEPIEVLFAPGAVSDVKIAHEFEYDLPENSTIYGDRIYNDYELEEFLKEHAGINFLPLRKSNMKKQHSKPLNAIIRYCRKSIETVFSSITSLFPKSIHAITAKGFELKIMFFILAYGISKIEVAT